MAELKEPKEVFNEAHTRNPGTITLTVPELEKLLRASAPTSVDIKDNRGELPVFSAAEVGNLDVVKYFVEKKPAVVNSTNNFRETPVYMAAEEGHHEVVKYLVEEAKADAFIQERGYGYTAFQQIARRGWLDLVKYLAKKNPAGVNIENSNGRTALVLAEDYCIRGADCSSVVDYLKAFTAILEAAKEGKLDVVKYLFKKNPASVNITNGNGETPVHLAAKKGHLQVVKFLVEEAKADAYFKDKEFGATPLHWSAFEGHLDVVKYLVERNPKSIDIKNNREETPLEVAKRCSSLDCSSLVEYLKTFKN